MASWLMVFKKFWMPSICSLMLRKTPRRIRSRLISLNQRLIKFNQGELGFVILDAMGAPNLKFNERPGAAVHCFLSIGPLEEWAKVLLSDLFVIP
jgi:hypothetical protein